MFCKSSKCLGSITCLPFFTVVNRSHHVCRSFRSTSSIRYCFHYSR